ncbi:MAG: tryptophan--tRNA ligase [Candidatus Pacebacteria bacterium]|nr:tryptophan--tRNA ligase [Candidatus Paceibacterota bacterium]
MKKTLLTGIQPSGNPHIGNYFGMMKQVVDMQDEYTTLPFIANLHSLNTIQNAEEMKKNITNVVIDYLAIGLDPKKVTLFKQSDVPQTTELCWIFNTIVTMPYLMRAHAFKDAEAKNKEISVGTFDYPILMAADILIQDTDVVPVGKDQQQHVEMARDIAEKFNRIYGETFKLPEAIIKKEVAVVQGTDGQKMSKSYGNTIPLFTSEEETEKIVMTIAMDSKGIEEKKNPDDYNLYKIAKLFVNKEQDTEIRAMFENGGVGYAEIKKYTAKIINDYLRPMREKRKELEKNPERVLEILEKGGKIANERAEKKMMNVRKKCGLR